jgi:putative nucleotidyltransferase with HDIG domain
MDTWVLRSKVESIDNLPTIPPILKKLLQIIENPNLSLNDLGSFILSDPVLTSRVLKSVNSPVYGFPCRISTVSQALILLGLNVVRGLLLGVSVYDVMKNEIVGLWEHSLGCALTAGIIAKKKAPNYFEEVTVAALLHDIGKVILSLTFPQRYNNLMIETNSDGSFIFESEKKYFGVTHAGVGAWLAQKWSFPLGLVEVVEYHHKPHLSRNVPLQTSIVHVSDILVRAMGMGFPGDNFVPSPHPSAWEILYLTDGELREVLIEMEDAFPEAATIFT